MLTTRPCYEGDSCAAVVQYRWRDEDITVAKVIRKQETISLRLMEYDADKVPYTKHQIREFVLRLIENPIKQNKLRRSRFSENIPELISGSSLHFEMLCREFGPFTISQDTEA